MTRFALVLIDFVNIIFFTHGAGELRPSSQYVRSTTQYVLCTTVYIYCRGGVLQYIIRSSTVRTGTNSRYYYTVQQSILCTYV